VNPKLVTFVNAYLGEANGNGTKAAVTAGYSEATAAQAASRLLKRDDVREAIGKKLQNADIQTDAILKRLGKIAHTEPESFKGSDVVAAAKVILQVNGALKDKQPTSGVVVNIGFLAIGQAPQTQERDVDALSASTALLGDVLPEGMPVMPPQPHAPSD
jgi:hypothetical protein